MILAIHKKQQNNFQIDLYFQMTAYKICLYRTIYEKIKFLSMNKGIKMVYTFTHLFKILNQQI
ncbi:hypothetical protein pb186bvf_008284 [Paramecium bursaria]